MSIFQGQNHYFGNSKNLSIAGVGDFLPGTKLTQIIIADKTLCKFNFYSVLKLFPLLSDPKEGIVCKGEAFAFLSKF